jgi:hypothetical protein
MCRAKLQPILDTRRQSPGPTLAKAAAIAQRYHLVEHAKALVADVRKLRRKEPE